MMLASELGSGESDGVSAGLCPLMDVVDIFPCQDVPKGTGLYSIGINRGSLGNRACSWLSGISQGVGSS